MSVLFPKTISAIRLTFTRVKGKPVYTPAAFTFIGNVQPTSGKQIENLPVAINNKGAVKVYSNDPLIVATEGGDTTGDIVIYNGKQWQVIYEMPYQNDLINHYKYIAQYYEENP
jgi:hypothetical protein